MQAIPTTSPGVSNFGLVKVRNNDALAAEQQFSRPTEPQQAINGLSAHLNKLLSHAKTAKEPVERQMLKNMRQRHGIYESDKLAAIRQMGGSEVYVLLTMTKCRAAEAWINDILRPVGDRPWTIQPTPRAELPKDVEARIKSDADKVAELVIQGMAELGLATNPHHLNEEMQKYEGEIRDRMIKEIQREAKERCERMAQLIDDQLVEGGWNASFWAFINDLITLKAGIFKGPVVRKRKVHKWAEVEGTWQIQVAEELIPEFDRVSPFDFYPLSGATSPQDGSFERHHLSRSDLVAMIGVPGYSEEKVRAALQDYGEGKRDWLSTDTERAMLEHGQTHSLLTSDRIEAWEFWGSVQGKYLQQWGIPVADADLDYEVNCWQVGNHTIRAILNPDKLGRKPYSVDSFERVPGSVWGKGLPELMSDIQDVCNAVARAMVNNAGLASGPQVEVNKDRCSDNEEIWPWKIWQSTNQQMAEAPAVRFTQPTIVVSPLLQVYNTFSMMADDQTGVPRWSHGNTNVGGAGDTSSGLSMLMTSAARGIKEVISHVDTVVAEVVGRTYDYNMLYSPDPMVKGDAKVLARGSSSLLAKEQSLVRMNEFLAATNNPTDMQIIGFKGRAKLLFTAAKLLEIDTDGVIPDSDSDLDKLQAAIEAQAMQVQAAAPQPKPKKTDPAGNPAGGAESNLYQNREGQASGGNVPR